MPHTAGAQPKLDDWMLAGYRRVIETGQWDGRWLSEATGVSSDEIVEAQRTLVELRLIERSNGNETAWRAVSPQTAIARLVMPIEDEARRQATYADSLREQLQQLMPVHEATYTFGPSHAVEVVADMAALDSLIDYEMARCTNEAMVIQPRPDGSTAGNQRYLDARGRGVHVRALFQHSARDDEATTRLIRPFSEIGALVRTVDDLPTRLLIIDRSVCVLITEPGPQDAGPTGNGGPTDNDGTTGNGGPTGDETGVAVILRHPLVVSAHIDVFECLWARGRAFHPNQPQPPWMDNELRESILRLLALGMKDDAVARRLGISVRSCRRSVANLMSELGAASRFQAGVEARRRDLV